MLRLPPHPPPRPFVLGDRVEIVGHALLLQVADHILDFLVGDEGAMQAQDTAAAGHVEHVALAEQLLGALFAQNRAAVDLRGDLEAHPRRQVCLDGAGDHVDARALRRGDEMNAGGARHLGKSLHRGFETAAPWRLLSYQKSENSETMRYPSTLSQVKRKQARSPAPW